jgi:hypothetical protein
MVVSFDTLGFIHSVEGQNKNRNSFAHVYPNNENGTEWSVRLSQPFFRDVVIHSISTDSNITKWILTCNDMIISQGNDSNIEFNQLLPFMCQNANLQLIITTDDKILNTIYIETSQLNINEVNMLLRMSYFYDVMKYNDFIQIVRYQGGTILLPSFSLWNIKEKKWIECEYVNGESI